MANISKCKFCGNQVPKNAEILRDFDGGYPYRLCSSECFNKLMEKETAHDGAMQDWEVKCSEAIAKGMAEEGETFDSASDGQIMSWINKYANNN